MSGDCRPLALTKSCPKSAQKSALGRLALPLSNVFESCDLQHKGLLLLAKAVVVVSKSLVHFLAQLRTLTLCHFMAHYHFSSASARSCVYLFDQFTQLLRATMLLCFMGHRKISLFF